MMQRWVERAYERSPVLLQHAWLSLYGWKLTRVRYGGDFAAHLAELLRTQHYSDTELEALQNEELRRLIRHCYDNVPYYACVMRERRLTPDDIRCAGDLEKLPTLDKETIRCQPELFVARTHRRQRCEIVGTSGTTGKTLRIRVDLCGRRRSYAFFSRLKHWAAIPERGRVATFAGRTVVPSAVQTPPFWRYNLAARTLLFSSYHLSERTAASYLLQLRAWQPDLIDSYPSSLGYLAEVARDCGIASAQPRAVITSSETLTETQRAAIGAAFHTRVFDQYGAAEQVSFISQCEAGSYHVHPEYGITEFVPVDHAPPGARTIVATGFTNYAMPLLRYRTGDLATPKAGRCRCGRAFPMVEHIVGRMDDLLVTPQGRRVGRLDPIFKGLECVRRAQIVQDARDHVVVRIVPGVGFDHRAKDSIHHELTKRLGDDVTIGFQLVDALVPGAGGKVRAVVSLIR